MRPSHSGPDTSPSRAACGGPSSSFLFLSPVARLNLPPLTVWARMKVPLSPPPSLPRLPTPAHPSFAPSPCFPASYVARSTLSNSVASVPRAAALVPFCVSKGHAHALRFSLFAQPGLRVPRPRTLFTRRLPSPTPYLPRAKPPSQQHAAPVDANTAPTSSRPHSLDLPRHVRASSLQPLCSRGPQCFSPPRPSTPPTPASLRSCIFLVSPAPRIAAHDQLSPSSVAPVTATALVPSRMPAHAASPPPALLVPDPRSRCLTTAALVIPALHNQSRDCHAQLPVRRGVLCVPSGLPS